MFMASFFFALPVCYMESREHDREADCLFWPLLVEGISMLARSQLLVQPAVLSQCLVSIIRSCLGCLAVVGWRACSLIDGTDLIRLLSFLRSHPHSLISTVALGEILLICNS